MQKINNLQRIKSTHLQTGFEKINKVLIVTYYWPPSGGSGVQRWLKFAKYLPQLGWKPYVFTPENPLLTVRDESLLQDIPSSVEVVKLPIWEPYSFFFKISNWLNKKNPTSADFISTQKKGLFQHIASFIRGNFFIPDARIFWVKPAVSFLHTFIQTNQINNIITTGPPHSMHLIGLRLKNKNSSIKWIADFRDPWSEWDLLDTLSLSQLARKRHRKLERKVLTQADHLITISPYHVQRLEVLSDRKVMLITNGFDEDDFKNIVRQRTKKFTLRHIGTVDELRDPRPVMSAIRELCLKDDNFNKNVKIEFVGSVNTAFKEYVKADAVLSHVTQFVSSIPHQDLLQLYGQTDVQLLVLAHTAIASGNVPGKFFEYLASGNPILAIGPAQGDVANMLTQTGGGKIFERDNSKDIMDAIYLSYTGWEKLLPFESPNILSYTRRQLTQQLIHILAV